MNVPDRPDWWIVVDGEGRDYRADRDRLADVPGIAAVDVAEGHLLAEDADLIVCVAGGAVTVDVAYGRIFVGDDLWRAMAEPARLVLFRSRADVGGVASVGAATVGLVSAAGERWAVRVLPDGRVEPEEGSR